MSITYTCDTCGEVIADLNNRRSIKLERDSITGGVRLDSCRECVEKLKAGVFSSKLKPLEVTAADDDREERGIATVLAHDRFRATPYVDHSYITNMLGVRIMDILDQLTVDGFHDLPNGVPDALNYAIEAYVEARHKQYTANVFKRGEKGGTANDQGAT